MSYGITPYRVDMDQLQALFGSQDTALKLTLAEAIRGSNRLTG